MIKKQGPLISNYMALYDIIIPKDHKLRKYKELIDFDFINNELENKYTLDFGRPGYPPALLFKYLFLKIEYNLSDRGLIDRVRTDLAFKFFLNMTPEQEPIDHSLLSNFRRQRLKDENLLDLLIGKTIEIAKDKGIKLTGNIIVDSTHTAARFNGVSPTEALLQRAKLLRKKVYETDETYVDKMPAKPHGNELGNQDKVIEYSKELIKTVKSDERLMFKEEINERVLLLEEQIDDINANILVSKDIDAKLGYKSADVNFFGYKSHLAMDDNRLIVGAVVTTGEVNDGKELKNILDKVRKNNIEIKSVIGDGAYSTKDNIILASKEDKEFKLVANLPATITKGTTRGKKGFEYNKDLDDYICPSGRRPLKQRFRSIEQHKKNGTPLKKTYFYDVKKCAVCPLKDICGYKEGQKTMTYGVTLKRDIQHLNHQKNMDSNEYKELMKSRYKIEAKNAELKNQHGYRTCKQAGLLGMNLQAALSIFVVNIKRIDKLMS